ncbi:MAG TPA: DUF1801 domain-containing protein [Jiangellaceae bacterium]|nr:DUF1801 domain-containing protein [Jiangellaceae bacterium]
MAAVDDLLSALDPPQRMALAHVRDLVLDVVPDATQGTSYGLAAFRHQGKPLIGFGIAKQHLSVFPFSPQVVDGVRDRLAGFALSKGTIRFTVDRPLPDDVVRDIVRLRAAEIAGPAR